MKKIMFILFFACGCANNPRYAVTTEARTTYFPYAQQNIEKVDLSVQFKKEW
jgi:hypothetical protein